MSALSQYTQTDRTDHEIAKTVIVRTLTNEAVGKVNTVSSAELADRATAALPPEKHIGASAIRDLIPEVRLEYRLPIGNANGYFIIDDADELDRQVQRQRRQAQTSIQTAKDIAAAWNRSEWDD